MRFVDYGNQEEKTWSDLVELPAALSNVKKIAQTFVLYGLRPKYDRGTEGYNQVKCVCILGHTVCMHVQLICMNMKK